MSYARNLAKFATAVGGLAPAGAVLPFAGATAPTDWLLCAGQTVSRTTYADLFAAIGTAYGAGNGTTTFTLPDLRGRIPGGKDDMGGTAASRLTTASGGVDGTTLGAAGGVQAHTLTSAQIPAHSHPVTDAGDSHTAMVTGGAGGGSFGVGDNGASASTSTATTGITVGNNTGGGSAHPNVQPTIVLNYIIKT